MTECLGRKIAFLDRDGVINIDHGYIGAISAFEFSEGIFESLLRLKEFGYEFIIVTNQSGVARNYFTRDDLETVHKYMCDQLKKNGIEILQIYTCLHHPEITGKCDCRKPGVGMLKSAAQDYKINLKDSILIGDKSSDIKMGESFGLRNNYFIKGRYNQDSTDALEFENISQCTDYITKKENLDERFSE